MHSFRMLVLNLNCMFNYLAILNFEFYKEKYKKNKKIIMHVSGGIRASLARHCILG